MDCATIATGVMKACREVGLKVPLVVRLEGTNVVEARRILETSGVPMSAALSFGEAAKKVVESIQ